MIYEHINLKTNILAKIKKLVVRFLRY